MPKVASIDYLNKRIYLSAETVGVSLDTMDIYREVRELRRTNLDHRKFNNLIRAGGNIQKTPISFTQTYVQLLNGCRIVPFDTSHDLKVTRETFTDDNLSGSDVFDRTSLSPTTIVNIDFEVDKVETRVVNTGSGLTAQDIIDIKNAFWDEVI